uniref:Uncharacterized protein n=1 Tax=Astatotilapia calliptera TaxID=8154 RepID=A0AAX7US16_ASTCA
VFVSNVIRSRKDLISLFSLLSPNFFFCVQASRETYDNAHFYILFVMFFYSFLAMTLFKCFIDSDEEKKDPYEEFIKTGRPSTQMGGNIEKCGSMAGRNLLL